MACPRFYSIAPMKLQWCRLKSQNLHPLLCWQEEHLISVESCWNVANPASVHFLLPEPWRLSLKNRGAAGRDLLVQEDSGGSLSARWKPFWQGQTLAPREPVRLLDGQGAHDPSPNLDLKVPGMQAARQEDNEKQKHTQKHCTATYLKTSSCHICHVTKTDPLKYLHSSVCTCKTLKHKSLIYTSASAPSSSSSLWGDINLPKRGATVTAKFCVRDEEEGG